MRYLFCLLALILCACQSDSSRSNWGGSPIEAIDQEYQQPEANWGGSPIP